MSGRKLLIDTNVFIGLEDEREVPPDFATLQQLCAQHGVRIFIHERAADDIRRDRNDKRRDISLSKIRKFEQLRGVSQPPKAELEAKFGTMPKPTDVIDKCFLAGSELFSSRAWVTARRRAGREAQALPRSLQRRTSVAAPVRTRLGPRGFQPETKRA
jgi:hypothetical protein